MERKRIILLICLVIAVAVVVCFVYFMMRPGDAPQGGGSGGSSDVIAEGNSGAAADIDPAENNKLFLIGVGTVMYDQRTEEKYVTKRVDVSYEIAKSYQGDLAAEGYTELTVEEDSEDLLKYTAANADGRVASVSYAAGTLDVDLELQPSA
ncbi:MAG: hypothetical protein LBS85_03790 [Clostridiales Family XIII bacterium]|jgi:hypothetical protein|nr:hypothetical protein [Clostridiales Family XIII bacterium]